MRSRPACLIRCILVVCGCATGANAAVGGTSSDAEGERAEGIEEVVVVVGRRGAAYSSATSTASMRREQTPLTSVLAVADSLPGVSVHEGDPFGFDDWSTTVSERGFQLNLDEQQISTNRKSSLGSGLFRRGLRKGSTCPTHQHSCSASRTRRTPCNALTQDKSRSTWDLSASSTATRRRLQTV